MADIFLTQRSKIPTGDSRIIRVGFEEAEVGARKRFLPKLTKRSEMSIVHVKSGS